MQHWAEQSLHGRSQADQRLQKLQQQLIAAHESIKKTLAEMSELETKEASVSSQRLGAPRVRSMPQLETVSSRGSAHERVAQEQHHEEEQKLYQLRLETRQNTIQNLRRDKAMCQKKLKEEQTYQDSIREEMRLVRGELRSHCEDLLARLKEDPTLLTDEEGELQKQIEQDLQDLDRLSALEEKPPASSGGTQPVSGKRKFEPSSRERKRGGNVPVATMRHGKRPREPAQINPSPVVGEDEEEPLALPAPAALPQKEEGVTQPRQYLPRDANADIMFRDPLKLPASHKRAMNIDDPASYNVLFHRLYLFAQELAPTLLDAMPAGTRLRDRAGPVERIAWRMDTDDPNLTRTVRLTWQNFTEQARLYLAPGLYTVLTSAMANVKLAAGPVAAARVSLARLICDERFSQFFLPLVQLRLSYTSKKRVTSYTSTESNRRLLNESALLAELARLSQSLQ